MTQKILLHNIITENNPILLKWYINLYKKNYKCTKNIRIAFNYLLFSKRAFYEQIENNNYNLEDSPLADMFVEFAKDYIKKLNNSKQTIQKLIDNDTETRSSKD